MSVPGETLMTRHTLEAPLDGHLSFLQLAGNIVQGATFDRDSGGYTRLTIRFANGVILTALEQELAGEFNVTLEGVR